jgi:hypothetical protein
MSQHTPGTWYAVGAYVEHDDDSVADICSCDPATIGQKHLGRSYEEIIANAKLIAAAPDLLEALERIAIANEYDILRGRQCAEEMRQIARHAIRSLT